jgi:hypothetical protein
MTRFPKLISFLSSDFVLVCTDMNTGGLEKRAEGPHAEMPRMFCELQLVKNQRPLGTRILHIFQSSCDGKQKSTIKTLLLRKMMTLRHHDKKSALFDSSATSLSFVCWFRIFFCSSVFFANVWAPCSTQHCHVAKLFFRGNGKKLS